MTLTFQNGPPNGGDDTYAMLADQPLVVNAADGVLKDDTDIDLDPSAFPDSPALDLEAQLVDQATFGDVSLNADGSFTYTPPDPDWYGTDTFTYRTWDLVNGQRELSDIYPATVTIKVNKLHVYHDGFDTTALPSETVVGKKVNLRLKLRGPGFDEPVDILAVHWTIPGEKVTDYEVSLEEGLVSPFTPAHLMYPTVGFYWIDGIALATVSATATVRVGTAEDYDDYATGAEGHLIVQEPTATQPIESYYGPITVDGDTFTARLMFGDPAKEIPGVRLRGHAKAPPDFGGEFGFIQLVSGIRSYKLRNGDVYILSTDGQVLDSDGPAVLYDAAVAASAGETVVIPPPGAYLENYMQDSPGVSGIPLNAQWIDVDETFSDFLVYRPNGADSIWVSFRKFRWGWNATAINYGTGEIPDWRLGPGAAKDGREQGPTLQLPKWDARAQDLQEDPGFQLQT